VTADRMRRVDEAVREVLSDAISHQVKDPRVGFVTVTAVETAPDLRRARVFVSVLGEPAVRQRTLQGLQSAHGILQAAVARELRLKHTPALEFVYDDTADRGMRISELIDREAER
jgi:ribosome-binding factor A